MPEPPETGFVIRRACGDDADTQALSLIGSASFLETFADHLDGDAIVAFCRDQHSAAYYRQAIDDGAAAWLVEQARTRAPIGFALLTRCALAVCQQGDLELRRIYVLSPGHGRGIGPQLLDQIEEEARTRHARRLVLDVFSGNARARAFYLKRGFIDIGEMAYPIGQRHYDSYLMAKAIG